LLKSGKFNRVPVIIGSNSDEGTTFVLINYELEGSPVTADGYGAAIENLMPTADVDDVMRLYPLSDYPSPSQALAAARTDAASCPINSAAKMYAGKVPTYAYVFADRNAPFPLGKLPTLTMGAGHGFEMQYLFQSQGIPLVSTTPTQFDAAQQAVSDSLTGYWAEFMAEQAPEKGGGPAWPTFKAANGKRIVFNSDATIVSAGDFDQEHHCDFWLSQKG
jgi:para-nitrobenzyl esterase